MDDTLKARLAELEALRERDLAQTIAKIDRAGAGRWRLNDMEKREWRAYWKRVGPLVDEAKAIRSRM